MRRQLTLTVDEVEVFRGEEPWCKSTYRLTGRAAGESLPVNLYTTAKRVVAHFPAELRGAVVVATYAPECRKDGVGAVAIGGDKHHRVVIKSLTLHQVGADHGEEA